jgi:hypothetical protein
MYLGPVRPLEILFSLSKHKHVTAQLNLFQLQNERADYEVIVDKGKLMYRRSGFLVETTEDSKWIFVLSTTRSLYIGQVLGMFHPSLI